MATKHFVLVHAASHGAWVWYKIKPGLEAEGYKVTVMDLAASGIDTRSIDDIHTADEYSQPLLDIMNSIPEGEKVILVGESYGGINITIAADNFPQKIAVAVYLNAFMPDTDNTPSFVIEKFNENPPDWLDCTFSTSSDGKQTIILGPNFLKTTLYQNSPIEDYTLATILTRKGSLFAEALSKREKFTQEGYGSVSRVYIMGDEDKLLTKEFQLWQVQNFEPKEFYTIPGGDHKLMFSKTEQLLSYLFQIASSYA